MLNYSVHISFRVHVVLMQSTENAFLAIPESCSVICNKVTYSQNLFFLSFISRLIGYSSTKTWGNKSVCYLYLCRAGTQVEKADPKRSGEKVALPILAPVGAWGAAGWRAEMNSLNTTPTQNFLLLLVTKVIKGNVWWKLMLTVKGRQSWAIRSSSSANQLLSALHNCV